MEDILSLEKTAMERWRNGDPMGFVELSATDVSYVDPGLTRPIRGLEEYRDYLKQVIGKIFYQGSDFIEPKIVQVGDAALLTYNYQSTRLDKDGNVAARTPWNATEVYFYRQGDWKIVHTHWSFIHHKAPDLVEVPLPIPAQAAAYDGVLGELIRLESAAMERWRKGDPWGYTDLYAPDVTYFDTGTPQRINGKEALVAEYQLREGKIFYDVMDFIDPFVQVRGDMAVLFYRFLSTRLLPDGAILHRTPWNCTEIYQHLNGGWKIIHNHWSLIRGERY